MDRFKRRYPKTPWLYDERDLRPQGEPEVQVFLGTMEILLGLHVRGVEAGAMIAIRWNGEPVSAVIPDGGLTLEDDAA